jgi:hypothetical protein
MGTELGGRFGLDQHVGSGSLSVEYIDLVNMGDCSLLIPMCKNSKLKATTTTTISNSDNLSLGVSSLAS